MFHFTCKLNLLEWMRGSIFRVPSLKPAYTVNLVAWMFSACFAKLFPVQGEPHPDVQGRIEATTALLYSSQGPRVCVIRPFSQLIPCWADNELGQGAVLFSSLFLYFFTPAGTGLVSYVCLFSQYCVYLFRCRSPVCTDIIQPHKR